MSDTFEEEVIRRLTLSLPAETYKRLQFLSKQSHRSMTKFVHVMVDSTFENAFGKDTKVGEVIHNHNQLERGQSDKSSSTENS